MKRQTVSERYAAWRKQARAEGEFRRAWSARQRESRRADRTAELKRREEEATGYSPDDCCHHLRVAEERIDRAIHLLGRVTSEQDYEDFIAVVQACSALLGQEPGVI